ncbi:helical backbone metal receptor [Glaciecola siphonariae]|uniref:Helical backbone metal receptor n=1 Tax=Glaciecola siphonariae TaxID=521012 RepID=A0ABV9M2A4_9ALTE
MKSLMLSFLLLSQSIAYADSTTVRTEIRIVTLSPHLTELVFALGLGKHVVGVSDFSDFPADAESIPRVASYQGANIPAILRLKPTHVLAWQGGNKDVDIMKMKQAGLKVYLSKIESVDTLKNDISEMAAFLGVSQSGESLIAELSQAVSRIKNRYAGKKQPTLYYLNNHPLVALGNDKWINDLLDLCGLSNIFRASIAPYPQVSVAQILRLEPQLIVSASNESKAVIESTWREHNSTAYAKVILADADKMHRFTPRAIIETARICEKAYTNL